MSPNTSSSLDMNLPTGETAPAKPADTSADSGSPLDRYLTNIDDPAASLFSPGTHLQTLSATLAQVCPKLPKNTLSSGQAPN